MNSNEPRRQENNICARSIKYNTCAYKSLLENYLQLSKSIFFKSVLLKLTKNLFTSVYHAEVIQFV